MRYVTFNSIEEVVTVFKEEVTPMGEEEEEEEEEDGDEDQWTTLGNNAVCILQSAKSVAVL